MITKTKKSMGIIWFSVGGAPLLYFVVAVLTVIVMGFVPASVVVGTGGGGWPLHDAIHPVIGLVLGPIAGPIASMVGFALSNAITPYTSLGAYSYLLGGMSAFTVGMLVQPRKGYWLVPWLIIATAHIVFFFETRGYGISPLLWFSNTFTVTIALILVAIPPLRRWALQIIWVESTPWKMFAAYSLLFFLGSAAGIQLLWSVTWPISPWGAEHWPDLIIVIFLERTVFTLIGSLIATIITPLVQQSSWPTK